MNYRTLFIARHVLPDDRLAYTKVYEDGLVAFAFRAGHIHPALVRDLDAVSADVTRTGILELNPEGDPCPSTESEVVRVEDWLTGDRTNVVHVHLHDGKMFFEVLVNEHLIDSPTVREMNTEMFPAAHRVLVPARTMPSRITADR